MASLLATNRKALKRLLRCFIFIIEMNDTNPIGLQRPSFT